MPDLRAQEITRQVDEAISSIADTAAQIDAIAKIRGWFRPNDDNRYYPLIQEHLAGKSSLSEAAEKIFGPIDDALSELRLEDQLAQLWTAVLYAAKRMPYSDADGHTRLIELVRALKTRPEPAHQYAGYADGVYNSLSEFGYTARSFANDSPGVGSGYTVPEASAWANFNYFLARVTGEGLDDFWVYTIWELRAALEQVIKDDGPTDAHKPGTAKQKYDTRIPAAAVWVSVLGRKLYENETDMTPKKHSKQPDSARGGELWKGRSGFSRERWRLWKERFDAVSKLDEISEETRKIAKEAFETMEQSER